MCWAERWENGGASGADGPGSGGPPTPGSGSGGSGVGCALLDTPTACAGQLGCRWLAPGCGENPLPKAGCFPAVACSDDDDCAPLETCTDVVYDPCHGESCEACGMVTRVCL
jgi:hypothetical protein